MLSLSLIIIVLTVLSRLGHPSLLGVSLVISDSMEPALRRGDLAIYASGNFTVGDVVVYCVTPSHCVVHRVIGFLHLNTVSGNRTMVVTKGDNVDVADSPVELERVRGTVVFAIPRELWIPVVLSLLAYSLYIVVKIPVVGLSCTILFAVGLVSVVAVYAVVPRPLAPNVVKAPVVNLAGVYFDQATCTVSVRYTGELSITGIDVKVNSTPVDTVSAFEREYSFKPSPELLREAFENGLPLVIEVDAVLNHAGRLTGKYDLLVGGLNPELSAVNGVLVARNSNCFPIAINVSIRYYDGGWKWSNGTYTVNGFSYHVVEPPREAQYAYAYVYWFNQGDKRWVGLPLRTG
ncbi:MAG: signal peptidase I [Desulfurococcaceae archaeon]